MCGERPEAPRAAASDYFFLPLDPGVGCHAAAFWLGAAAITLIFSFLGFLVSRLLLCWRLAMSTSIAIECSRKQRITRPQIVKPFSMTSCPSHRAQLVPTSDGRGENTRKMRSGLTAREGSRRGDLSDWALNRVRLRLGPPFGTHLQSLRRGRAAFFRESVMLNATEARRTRLVLPCHRSGATLALLSLYHKTHDGSHSRQIRKWDPVN